MLLKETVFQKGSGTSSNDNVLTNNLHIYRTEQKKLTMVWVRCEIFKKAMIIKMHQMYF